jgi:hypothetical protein
MDLETSDSNRRDPLGPRWEKGGLSRFAGVVIACVLAVGALPASAHASAHHGVVRPVTSETKVPLLKWRWLRPDVRPAPLRRVGAAMAYDPVTHTMVLWGGGEPTLPFRKLGANVGGDTWGYDGSTWRRLPAGPPRIASSLVFDPDASSFVAFGGSNESADALGDTWTFDGTTWTRVATSGPPPRHNASMAYDPTLHEIILFGGYTAQSTPLGDTWVWKPTTGWTELSPSPAPPARFGGSMVFDPQVGKLLLFAGETANGIQNDAWTFDGSSWQQLALPASPPSRIFQSMTYDSSQNAVVMWGGLGAHADFGDTWLFADSRWTMLSLPPGGPKPGAAASMAYDPATHQSVLLGGGTVSGSVTAQEWAFGN